MREERVQDAIYHSFMWDLGTSPVVWIFEFRRMAELPVYRKWLELDKKKEELVDLIREITENSRPMTGWEARAAAEFLWPELGC